MGGGRGLGLGVSGVLLENGNMNEEDCVVVFYGEIGDVHV